MERRPNAVRLGGLWFLLALASLCRVPAGHAFDGDRKGFTLGLHFGTARVETTRPYRGPVYFVQWDSAHSVADTLGMRPAPGDPPARDGLTTQLKLGYGFTPSWRLCYTAQTDIVNYSAIGIATDAGTNINVLGGSALLSLDWYPGGAGGRWFGSTGFGYGSTSDGGAIGPAYHLSAGLDFRKRSQAQLTVARYGTSSHQNLAVRLLVGWMWQ